MGYDTQVTSGTVAVMNKSPHERMIRGYILSCKDAPCMDCGIKYHPAVMEFDHRHNKSFHLSKPGRRSIATINEELSKCDLVCANCHRMRTVRRMAQASSMTVSKQWTLFND
jgi:hypothetical protein